ncbi:fimbrial biogenesis chaperone [Sphingobium sp. TomTYG45]
MMFTKLLRHGLPFLALASFGMGAQAARVTPMSVDLEPTGSRSSARLEVTNNEDRQLPMEVRMYRGTIGERGELDLQPADEKFMVFPPQTLMAPNSQQVFRIQYLPDTPPTQSEVYYASISQIPVQLPSDQSRIQVVMRFNVLVNVVPNGTTSDPAVAGITPITREVELGPDEKKPEEKDVKKTRIENGLEVSIENKGTRYFAAGRSGWTIKGTDATGKPYSADYDAAQMGEMIGMGIVAPGRTRIFFVPTPTKLAVGATVTLKR